MDLETALARGTHSTGKGKATATAVHNDLALIYCRDPSVVLPDEFFNCVRYVPVDILSVSVGIMKMPVVEALSALTANPERVQRLAHECETWGPLFDGLTEGMARLMKEKGPTPPKREMAEKAIREALRTTLPQTKDVVDSVIIKFRD